MASKTKSHAIIAIAGTLPIALLYAISYLFDYYTLLAPFCATSALVITNPTSAFCRPKNILFGYFIAISLVIFFSSFLDDHTLIGFCLAFALTIFLMLCFDVFHPSAAAVTMVEFFVGNNPDAMLIFGLVASLLMCVFANFYQKIHEKLDR